jgi:hypothetical protein
MKDLTERIKDAQGELDNYASDYRREECILKNQIAMMEALQDLQEKLMRIEGKMRNFK